MNHHPTRPDLHEEDASADAARAQTLRDCLMRVEAQLLALRHLLEEEFLGETPP
jgi:hypothetical protein